MSGIALPFALISIMASFMVSRRSALLPLLIAALYVPYDQQLELGPFHFTVIRLLVLAGVVRVLSRGESLTGGMNFMDRMMVFWAVWAMVSSVFHRDGILMTRFGEVYTELGLYFLFRIFLREPADIRQLCKTLCILFVPLAIAMLLEKLTARNWIGPLFGGRGLAYLRHGNVRAYGPFVHPITAGTVGAVCMPLALCLWRQNRKLALIGFVATGLVVFTSRSSGPIVTVLSILGGMALWKIRKHLRAVRWSVLLAIVAANFLMSEPVYFLIDRIDFAGGSTGWYRANLIRAAIQHVGEWWLIGTDVTSHWAGTNVVSGTDVDITNYYIRMGVSGGLLLMLLFMGRLFAGFAAVGKTLRLSQNTPAEQQFLIWTLGAILFGHAMTFISVSYFDPAAVLFLDLVLAAISSAYAAACKTAVHDGAGFDPVPCEAALQA